MAPTSGEVRRWSTAHLPAAQRLDYWVGAVCEGFLEMTVRCDAPSRFAASLASAHCGPLVVSRVRSCAADVHRTREAAARSSHHCYHLVGNLDAPWVAEHRGTPMHLQPCDFVIVDSQQRYALRFPMACETVSIQLPEWWLASWVPMPQAVVGRFIDGKAAWGAVLSGFLHHLSPEFAAAPPLPARLMTDQLGALLALACGDSSGCDAGAVVPATSMAARIADNIDQHHAVVGLTAAMVAARLDMSERTLHRQLATGQATFFQVLLARRMASARRMLADPRFDRLSIAEVGRRCGFADASHFIRTVRGHAGRTPLQLRKER